jgi:hypothetical protein
MLASGCLPYPLVALVTSTLRPVNVASDIFCSWSACGAGLDDAPLRAPAVAGPAAA